MALRKYRLNEAQLPDLGQDFDDYFAISDESAKEVLDAFDGNWGEIVDAARDGDDDCKMLLIKMSKQRILSVFWKNFINKSYASTKAIFTRINNGEFEDFCGLVMVAFDKAIKAFNAKKIGDKNPLAGFQYYLGQYIMKEAIMFNHSRTNDPNDDAIHADSIEASDKGGANGWDKLQGDGDLSSFSSEYNGFDEAWKQFCSDPAITSNKKYDIAGIIADMLDGTDVASLAEKYGVSKNTIRYDILQNTFVNTLGKYDITLDELKNALRRDDFRYIRQLRKGH